MGESYETSGDYHHRVDVVAQELATALQETGLEATLERAQTEAANFNHDYRYLMGMATGVLFSSSDPDSLEHGLGYMEWEAEHFPEPTTGDGISYNARYDARTSREFAERCFKISLMHFRFASQAEGFTPSPSFIEDFNTATARIEEEGYPELYRSAILEFAPLVITVAKNLQSSELEKADDEAVYPVDSALCSIAIVAHGNSNPELALEAKSLITEPWQLSSVELFEVDEKLTEAMLAGDFQTAKNIIVENDHHPMYLWNPMLQKLMTNEKGASEWANTTLDTILEACPSYFSDQEYADFFYGRLVGNIIGILDRRDIIDTLINPKCDEHMTGIVAAGIAYGLGNKANQDGFNHLLTQIPHYSSKTVDVIHTIFNESLEEV